MEVLWKPFYNYYWLLVRVQRTPFITNVIMSSSMYWCLWNFFGRGKQGTTHHQPSKGICLQSFLLAEKWSSARRQKERATCSTGRGKCKHLARANHKQDFSYLFTPPDLVCLSVIQSTCTAWKSALCTFDSIVWELKLRNCTREYILCYNNHVKITLNNKPGLSWLLCNYVVVKGSLPN